MRTRDTILVSFANLLGRLTGMVSEVVMSAVFGAGKVTDAYYAAVRVPQLLRELLAEGSLQNAFVPAFSDAAEREGLDGAWRLANAFLGVLMLVLGGTALLFALGAPFFVTLVASGFESDPEKFDLTVRLTQWMSPFLMGLSLAGFVAAMLNVRGQFFLPALAQNAFNLLIIAGCLLGPQFEAATGYPAIFALALATTLSGFVQVAITLPGLLKQGYRIRPNLRGHPGLRKMLAFLGPALIGIMTVQFNFLVESNWASSYGDGPVTYLMKAFRLVQIPLAVFSGSVATTALASLAVQSARGEARALGDTLARALRLNSFLVLPSAVALGILAEPLVRLLFERGAFTAEDTAGTALMLQMYAFAVYGICFHRLGVPVYYALGNPRTPMWLSIGAMAAKIPVILLFTHGFGFGVEALPLSHAVTVTGESVLLMAGLRSRITGRGVGMAHLKLLVAATVLGLVAFTLRDRVHVITACVISGVAYLGVAGVLGVLELGPALRRGPAALPPTIDRDTEDALRAMARGNVAIEGRRISTATGAWQMVAEEGVLKMVPDGAGTAGGLSGDVVAVLRVGRPPTLKGFNIGARAWHAHGTEILEEQAEGPRIPISP